MTDDRPLAFLDIETTGLNPRKHQVWEVAISLDTWSSDKVEVYQLDHTLDGADIDALRINRYVDRVEPFRTRTQPLDDIQLRHLANSGDDHILRGWLTGAHVVGSNPSFDTAFLAARWREEPWHHRKIDVASMALAIFGWKRPKGMAEIAAFLTARGHVIPEPDHTAAGDVRTLRAVYYALRDESLGDAYPMVTRGSTEVGYFARGTWKVGRR